MTVQELMVEIRRLSFEERLELLESLTRTLREERRTNSQAGSSVNRVRGLLKPDGPLPTDAELADGYTDYLIEKYI